MVINLFKKLFNQSTNLPIRAAFGPDHPQVAIFVNNLGGVLQALGDLKGAKAAYQRALRIFKQFLPEDHPNIKIVQENLESLQKNK